MSPGTFGEDVIVPAGETLVVERNPRPHATAVSFKPKRYADLMKGLVDPKHLANPRFGAYSLLIDFEEVARCCVLESGAP
jgi:predicted ATP-grasp superfamily ATP-dependent carboligase